jgi:hypothetical protein
MNLMKIFQVLMSWQLTNKNWYFIQISSGKWVEIKDDKVIYSFDEIEIKNTNEVIQVILFASDRNFYLRLNNKDAIELARVKKVLTIYYIKVHGNKTLLTRY